MKRTPKGQSTDYGQRFHVLFAPIDGVSSDDFIPEPIHKIFVTRFDTSGPVQALRPFGPDELSGNDALFQRFGGGTYELVARRENGTIYAKRQITLPGEPKSMTGEVVPTQPPNGSAPASTSPSLHVPGMPATNDPMAIILTFVMQQNAQAQQMQMAQMTMLGQVLVAALGGKGGSAEEIGRIMAETQKSTIELMKAAAPPPGPPPVSPIAAAKEMLEVARMISPAPKPPPPPPAAEEKVADVIKALSEGVSPFVQMAVAAATKGATAAAAPAAPALPVG